MNKILALILLASILSAGCSPRRISNDDQPVNDEFGVSVQDVDVDQAAKLAGLKPLLKNGRMDIASALWLDTSRRLFEAAQALKTSNPPARERLLRMAQRVSDGFYALPYAATSMTADVAPGGNPFAEEAWNFVKDTLKNQYTQVMDRADLKVDQAITAAQAVVPTPKSIMPLDEAMAATINVLGTFLNELKARDSEGVHEIVLGVDGELRSDYINELGRLRGIVKKASPQESALQFLDRLKAGLQQTNLVSADDKTGIFKKLGPITRYAVKVDSLSSDEDTVQKLIDEWLAKDQRAAFPMDVRDKVTKSFQPYKEKEVIALAENNKHKTLADGDWQKLKDKRADLAASFVNDPATVTYAQSLVDDPLPSGPERAARVFEIIAGAWYNLDLREGFPELAALARFNADDLEKIRDDQVPLLEHPILHIARGKILGAIQNFNKDYPGSENVPVGYLRFKGYLNYAIIDALQKDIAAAVIDVAQTLPQKIKEGIHSTIKDLRAKAGENTFDLYKKYASTYLNKWFFNNGHLPLIEKRNLRVALSGSKLTNYNLSSETSAETLGLSLTDVVQRMNTLASKGLNVSEPAVRAMSFAAICKLQAMMGYKGLQGEQVPGLMTSLFYKRPEATLDLANYSVKNPFAVADIVPLAENYKLNPVAVKRGQPLAVAGQMELLSGLTDLLEYLKPWKKSAYDESLASLQIDEIPGTPLFPKDTFFLQALGLAATILQNVPVYDLAVVDLDQNLIPMAQVKDLSTVNVIGAVVTDATRSGPSHVIRTRDLALSILTLRRFLETTQDLGRSTDAAVRKAAKNLQGQQALFDKLFLGISMFAASHLMLPDGGFAESYDMDAHKTSDTPRRLEDQLLMQQALMVAGDFLNRDFVRLRAVENFFFLNSHFWSAELAFYDRVEGETAPRLLLRDVALAVTNASLMRSMLPRVSNPNFDVAKTVDQVTTLQNRWINRFFTDASERLSPLQDVVEFGIGR